MVVLFWRGVGSWIRGIGCDVEGKGQDTFACGAGKEFQVVHGFKDDTRYDIWHAGTLTITYRCGSWNFKIQGGEILHEGKYEIPSDRTFT